MVKSLPKFDRTRWRESVKPLLQSPRNSVMWQYLAGLGVFLLVSEWVLRFWQVPSYLLPLPSEVVLLIGQRFRFLMAETAITMAEAVTGFLIGNLTAFGLALFFVRFPKVEDLGIAMAVTVKAIPLMALSPLFVIWFGNGIFGKMLLAALVCFFPMLINATVGLRSVEQDILDYLCSLSASANQILWNARIPSSMPFVFAAARVSSTVSIVGAIVAELSGSDRGIGHILLVSIYQVETVIMFAAITCIAVAGIFFYAMIGFVEKWFFPTSTRTSAAIG